MEYIGEIIFFIFVIVAFISSMLIGFSFESLGFDQVGISYNTYYEKITADPKYTTETGRFMIGLNSKFIKFPKFLSSVEFSDETIKTDKNELIPDGPSLNCTTLEGIGVKLELNFYFSLDKNKLKDIYLNFGENWRNILIKISMETIKNTSIKLETILFFQERKTISDKILENLQNEFNKLLDGAFKIEIIQLRDIVFDKGLENALNLKLIQKHNKKLFEFNGQIFFIRITTDFLIIQAESKIKEINANAIGDGIKENEIELGKALKIYIENLNDTYSYLKGKLGITNMDNLLKFMYSMELKTYDLKGKSVLFLPPGTSLIKGVGLTSKQNHVNNNINLKSSIKFEDQKGDKSENRNDTGSQGETENNSSTQESSSISNK